MKCVLAAILSGGLFSAVCFGAEKPALTDTREKESYSLGYQFGEHLKTQKVDIDLDVYVLGIRDALGGTHPRLSQNEIRATVAEFQNRLSAARQKENREAAEKNLADGKAFLEENKKKDGVVTLPSGLQYQVLTEGSGRLPKATDTVTVNYRGTLVDGTEFDSSYTRGQPATFQVGKVVQGWAEGLQLMKEGSRWQLVIPPPLAYGARGSGRIPPNSTLIFEVELLTVK